MDANTTQIIMGVIGLLGLIVTGYVGIKQLQINKGQTAIINAQAVAAVAVANVDKKADIISSVQAKAKEELTAVKEHINGMQSLLLKSKDETRSAEVEAASLAGEAKGREAGIASTVVETVKNGNGELAKLKEEVHEILKRLEKLK